MADPSTPVDLDALKWIPDIVRLSAGAHSEPWSYTTERVGGENGCDVFHIHEHLEDDPPIATVSTHGTEDDARLIVLMRNLAPSLPALLAELEALREVAEAAHEFDLSTRADDDTPPGRHAVLSPYGEQAAERMFAALSRREGKGGG